MAQMQSPFVPSATSTPLAVSFGTPIPTATAQQPPPKPVMPPPDTFDIVPALHELINRLITPVPGAQTQPGSQPAFPNQQPLEIHQLAGEVSSVRNRIRRARKVVEELDDIDRTVDEQEAEMAALRERIEKQKRVLEGLRGG